MSENTQQPLISPTQPSGVIDFLPEQQIPRLAIIDAVRRVYERYGFDPVETPVIERLDVLTGDPDDFDMKLWRTHVSNSRLTSGQEMALRYDLTVPLARVVSANPDLPMPFKRWQYGHVMRGETPQIEKGRYREFAQLDADIVGAESPLADAEIIDIMCHVMLELGLGNGDFLVRFNNRKLLNGLPKLVGFGEEHIIAVLRIIDKFDKIGRDAVLDELRVITEEAGKKTVELIRFTEDQMDLFARFLDIDAEDSMERLNKLGKLFAGIGVAEEGLVELRTICNSLQAIGLLDTYSIVDLTIARGLGYYTGPVFETTLLKVPEIGSVYSGGRFDGLINRFSYRKLPATGASVGVDRLVNGLLKLGKLQQMRSMTEVLVLNLGDEFAPMYQNIASTLRSAGCRVSVYIGSEVSLRGQFGYAERIGVTCAVIFGEREMTSGVLGLKDLRTRNQESITFRKDGEFTYEELSQKVCKILSK